MTAAVAAQAPALRRYAILAPGVFASRSAKTAHGVIAYARDQTVAVIDPSRAGERVCDAVLYLHSDAPIVRDLDEALRYAPTALLIGVAPAGGALPAAWRAWILQALDANLEIVSGLHEVLADDAEFAAAAQRGDGSIWDVRVPPPPRLFTGEANAVRAPIALFVGSDCAVGKMTAALELTAAARAQGRRAEFVATGQTGIMIAGRGIAIDRVIADFASGAVEQLVLESAPDAEILFVEGQGGINHPAYAPVSLALLYGCAPDALILVHLVTRERMDGFGTPLLPLAQLVILYERLCETVKPAKVCGIALNTHGLDDAQARGAIDDARRQTGLPCDDVVRYGADAFYDAIAPALAHKGVPLK